MIFIKKIILKTTKNHHTRSQRLIEERERKLLDRSPLLLLLYCCGILGIVLCIEDVVGLAPDMIIILSGVTSLMTAGLWYLYFYRLKAFIIASVALILSTCFLIIPEVYNLSRSIRIAMNMGVPLSSVQVSVALIAAILLLLVYLLFALEFVLRNHSIMFVVGLFILIVIPISGAEISMPALILLMIFEFGFTVLNMTEKHRIRDGLVMKKKARAGMLSALLTALILVTAFIPAFLIEQGTENDMFLAVYRADGHIKDLFKSATGDMSGSISNGRINRGNLHQTGQQILIVNANERPTDTVYLHSFHGLDYSNSEWSSAYRTINFDDNYYTTTSYQESFMPNLLSEYLNDHDFIRKQENHDGFMVLSTLTSDPTTEMYYMLADKSRLCTENFKIRDDGVISYVEYNDNTGANILENPDSTMLQVYSVDNNYYSLYLPYNSSTSYGRLWSTNSINRDTGYNVSFLKYEQTNMKNRWYSNPFYERFIDSYIAKTREYYLGYPIEPCVRLSDYCSKTPLSTVNEVTTYILVTLQNKARYTITPGSTPYNKDVVDYFLFENGLGYCVHFASAATLMYRIYGIPARYVSGFALDPKLFQEASDGNGVYYTANVTDEYAHAWVEIYLKDYGWVPVEVTPDTKGMMSANYPGYDTSVMNSIMRQHGWSFRGRSIDGNVGLNESSGITFRDFLRFALPVVIILAFVVFIGLPVGRLILRKKRLSRYSCARLFDLTMRAIHCSGLCRDMNGSEPDFAEALSGRISSLSEDEIKNLVLTVQTYHYAEAPPSQEDRDLLQSYYQSVSSELYSSLSPFRKFIYKYLYGLP